MKMPNITPGPWGKEVNVINYRSGLKALEVRGSKNELITTFPGCDRDKANSTAIAALPDLLEALIEADIGFEAEGYEPDGPTRGPIRAALLKAGCTDA